MEESMAEEFVQQNNTDVQPAQNNNEPNTGSSTQNNDETNSDSSNDIATRNTSTTTNVPDVSADDTMVCCGRLMFPHQVRKYTKSKLEEQSVDADFIKDIFNVNDEVEMDYFCFTCYGDFKKGKRPRLCMVNGFKVPEMPDVLKSLNRVEKRLVAARHIFQSITKRGDIHAQYRTKGAVINVPVAVDTTASVLPRSIDYTNIIEVKLTRRMQDRYNYMEGVVNPRKVRLAAGYLRNSPLFRRHGMTIDDSL